MYTHMYARCLSPTEELTWDDVCELWDDGVYTADDVKKIAPLYFEGAELSAVLEVVEQVDAESATLEAMNTDSGDYLKRPATMKMCVEISNDLEFEHEQCRLEADCDTSQARGNPYCERAWRTLH